jgi:hypothetical protein
VYRALVALALMANVAGPAFARSDDATTHQPFDDVEHWRKVFDDPARDQWQKPRELVKALGVRPGMVVADGRSRDNPGKVTERLYAGDGLP